MCGRKSDPSVVEKSTTKKEAIGYESTPESKPITKLSEADLPEPINLELWKEALEVVYADACFGIQSRPENVYRDLLHLENI